ncbi:MAG: HAMP domain-containing protein [Azonexus sp.]|nr:HAMP domain-containing protein [Azonexus sp.]
MPRSLLARTFLLLALLILITTATWIGLFRYLDAEPRAREVAQMMASTVNLVRASLLAAAPERRIDLFEELSSREGVRLWPLEADDRLDPLPDSRFLNLLQQQLRERLGPQTRIAAAVNSQPGFWISFHLDGESEHNNANDQLWLILPSEKAARNVAGHLLLWGLLAVDLALIVAWLIASHISRPLRAMAAAAEVVGRGRRPPPLAEAGATEIRRLASAFNAMASSLERHEKDRSEVLAGISHDLRTPLTRLRLEAEMSIGDDAARQGVIADIAEMEAIISQFMDYARDESGEAAISADLTALLKDIAARKSATGCPLQLQIPALPPLELRPKALTRAIANLIDNASKHGGDGEIRLSATVSGDAIHIDLIDHGPGIPAAESERLKRPFTRLDTARSGPGGTGLGLAIVDRIARLHGGRLDLLPNPGGGLIARLVLPRQP